MKRESGKEKSGTEEKENRQVKDIKLLEQGYSLFMQAPVAIQVLKGPDLIVEFANEPTLKFWQKGKEVIGMPLAKVLPEMVEQGLIAALNSVRETGKTYKAYETPVIVVRHNREEVSYFNFIYKPYYEQGEKQATGVMIFANEVTEQVLAKRAWRESEERFRLMSDQVPQFIWMTGDREDNIIYVNQTMLRYLGIADDKSFNMEVWENILFPEDIKPFRNTLGAAVGEKIPYQLNCRFKEAATGKFRWFMINGTPRQDPEGNFIGYIGTGVDIHDSIMVEEKLEQLVRERTAQLERSNQDLQKFAHVASHDLKEPVRKIRIFANRLEMESGHKLNDDERTYLKKVQSAAERMNVMISGVLSYSMINDFEEITELIDLNEVIDNIKNDLEIPVQQKKAVIDSTGLPQVEGAAVLLHQLFYNLINNSLKFSKPDENVWVRITSRKTELKDGIFAEIILEDNGIGFEQDQAQKIFDPFTRLHSKEKYEGTGLGLSLCKKIAQRHHGSIRAEGNPGAGARFIILLPLVQK